MIRLAENFEKDSICGDNNRDLEGVSKTQVDKTNSSFPFTKENIDNGISEKYLIPSKSIASSKSNSSINITDNINNASNAHSKNGDPQSYLQSQNSPHVQILTIDLQIYQFGQNR